MSKSDFYRIWDNGNKCAMLSLSESSKYNRYYYNHMAKNDFIEVIPCDYDVSVELCSWDNATLNDVYEEILYKDDIYGISGSLSMFDIQKMDFDSILKGEEPKDDYSDDSSLNDEDEDDDCDNFSDEDRLKIVRWWDKNNGFDFDMQCRVISQLLSKKEVFAAYYAENDEVYTDSISFNEIDCYDDPSDYDRKGIVIGNIRDGESRSEAEYRMMDYLYDYGCFKNGFLNTTYICKIFEKDNGEWKLSSEEEFLGRDENEAFIAMGVPKKGLQKNFNPEDIQYVKDHLKIGTDEVFNFLNKLKK